MVNAQDSTNVKKNEIGINVLSILSQIFSTPGVYYVSPPENFPIEMMFKRNNGRKQAWRLGANISLNNNNVEPLIPGNTSRGFNNNISIILGSEWQNIFSKRWSWHNGADIIPYFYEIFSETKNEQKILNQSEEKGQGLILRPFLGLRFNINSQLYISTEASLNLKYGKSEYSSMYNSSADQITESHWIRNESSFKLNPAAGFFFFYKF